jgi:radical S-adenosyl methionine domain-containing protein 2
MSKTRLKRVFIDFIKRHKRLNPIAEDNNAMLESYIMLDPMGRFYQNSGNIYNYLKPILEIGVFRAFNQLAYNHSKFIERGGIYVYLSGI